MAQSRPHGHRGFQRRYLNVVARVALLLAWVGFTAASTVGFVAVRSVRLQADLGPAKAGHYVHEADVIAALPAAQTLVRIVSTSPSITETLFALGLGKQVVAVSRYCRFPPEVARLPKVGTFLEPDVELIARLNPDLVVVHPGPNGPERNLERLKIRYVTVDRGGLDSVFSSIRTIGAAAGATDRAAVLVADIQRRLDRVRAAVAARPRQRVLLIVGRRPGTLTDLIAVGRRSYMSDLAGIAGGVNVLSDSGLPEYPRISMETVIRLAPDVIIDAGDMGDTPEERRSRQVLTEGLWKRQQVAATRAGRVHGVISDAFVVPGPRVVEAAETMASWLHGVNQPRARP
jgi:ABC-type Fe3+-hydroxamate transport system substrate-binding protein